MVSNLRKISIGADVPKQLVNDLSSEMDAVKAYNEAIKHAGDVSDFATREVLESILNDEDRHVDEIEELQDQISHMTLGIFLSTKAG